jgi:RNA polymerase sigma-70 factor (ECF subfamily)
LQIAHLRILNELRHRQRRPQIMPDPEEKRLRALRDGAPLPDEAAWRRFQQNAVTDAVTKLPPRQREAVRLALFDDLTHAEVADTLQVPLGTAKTRIRDGMQRLRTVLQPVVAA